MALGDYPKLQEAFNALQSEKEELLKKTKKLRQRKDELMTLIAPYETELRSVNAEIAKIERPRLGEIDNELSAIAKAAGGYRLHQ